nr:unnamed protein product [Digitaria exilis]
MAANGDARGVPRPTNPMVTPLLTDLYQFTMAYAYWKAGKHLDRAVFDLYFRKNPFGGEFTIFGGLEECIRFIANFKITEDEIKFLRSVMPTCEDGFFEYLSSIDCSDVEVYAIHEGYVVFPKVPLMRIEGPVAVVQLLETPFLSLVNYASLVTTNAARHRLVAGKSKNLLEFGLRRAQGPDGGISASRYSYMGGFDATSNVAAGRLFGIPIRGTHSHAFVSSFMVSGDFFILLQGLDEITDKALISSDGSSKCEDFVSLVQNWLIKIKDSSSLGGTFGETNQSELAAFTSYALAFPNSFLALVDTYDVMRSGVPNFCAVALALNDMGNDLNEETIDALNKQGHEVDAFGIGTYLVTCYAQAALGCVFKLVEINKQPRIKLSEDVTKVSIPCKKKCYRLYGKEGYPLVDIMTGEDEPGPKLGGPDIKMCCAFIGEANSREELPSLYEIRSRCIQHLDWMRPDHMRRLNPTPYKVLFCTPDLDVIDVTKLDNVNLMEHTFYSFLLPEQVSVTAKLYDFIHFLWLNEAPVGELQ